MEMSTGLILTLSTHPYCLVSKLGYLPPEVGFPYLYRASPQGMITALLEALRPVGATHLCFLL